MQTVAQEQSLASYFAESFTADAMRFCSYQNSNLDWDVPRDKRAQRTLSQDPSYRSLSRKNKAPLALAPELQGVDNYP
jgi:hypothetical protein